MADGSLTGDDLANDSLGAPDLAPDLVGGSELADNSVGSANVTNNAITGADVDESSLDLDLTEVSGSSATDSDPTKTAVAPCPADTFLIGTGGHVVTAGGQFPADVVLVGARRNPLAEGAAAEGQEVAAGNTGNWRVTAIATCARVAG